MPGARWTAQCTYLSFMILNRVEKLMMNNPVRSAVQRHFEARRLLQLGGAMSGGHALEIGCGRGVGTELVLDVFGADRVDAFDLDPDMVNLARDRLNGRGVQVRLWTGDASAIDALDGSYDAVFDFGIIHHIPAWRSAVAEVNRVLEPGGRFYAEEVLEPFIHNPLWRRLLEHPMRDRFDQGRFLDALRDVGFDVIGTSDLWRQFAWFVSDKPHHESSRRAATPLA